ncbi:MAG: hypothetical protein ABIL25_10370 [candidate division WOR-3 bacterium]
MSDEREERSGEGGVMKRILVVTTVGESLSTDYTHRLLGDMLDEHEGGLSQDQRNELHKFFTLDLKQRRPPDTETLKTSLCGFNVATGAKDAPCAEIQSLLLLFQKLSPKRNGEAVSIDLVFVPTKETKSFAELIKGWFETNKDAIKSAYSGVCVSPRYVLSGVELDVGDKEQFHAGLAELTKVVIEELRKSPLKNGNYDERYLNITGGYKGIIPVLSLLGFTSEDVRVCYAHEKSSHIIIMPELPVAWDRQRLDEVRGYVLRGKISSGEYDRLPEPFKFLFLPKEHQTEYPRSSLGELVVNASLGEPRTRFGYGRYLMAMLQDKHRKELEAKLKEWEHLWIGDQIPETVEHSRLHTLRLLGFAHQLFSAYQDNGLLGKVGGSLGLYLLICAIWLHDIGHSALEYEVNGKKLPIALMPSLVREWHHYTSARLIRSGSYLDDKKEKEAVALLAEYHRGRMKLLNENGATEFDEPYGHAILTGRRPTLESKLKELRDSKGLPDGIVPEHMLLLAAILRFVDGCDVQADRIGGTEYLEARRKRTEDEVKFLQDRLKVLQSNHKECRYSAFAKYASPRSSEDTVALQVVSLQDQIKFKRKQFEHFKEHQSIALAFLYRKEGKLRVGLVPAGDSDETKKLVQKRAEGIGKEYESVRTVFNNAGICFEGVYCIRGGDETLLWEPDKKGGST